MRDVIDGEGTFEWAQGHKYTGSFRDGQMDGQGEFVNTNGTKLTGKFKRSLFDKVSTS